MGGIMLKVGERFVEFELAAHDGSTVRSSELEGAAYLLYFYPKASTPG
jgi:peroxiredoxin